MTEKEIYNYLSEIYKNNKMWYSSITEVASYLTSSNIKIKAKVLWMLAEFGITYPEEISPYVIQIALLMDDKNDLIKERAINALGRIGRAKYNLISPYWSNMFQYAQDNCPRVRLIFIWASENIATNYPELYKNYMNVFSKFLDDTDTKVRMESPEIFRVIGKRKPEYVKPYLDKLKDISINDADRVVRIHASGAIKATITSDEFYSSTV